MSVKSSLSLPYARYHVAKIKAAHRQPGKTQLRVLRQLLHVLRKTAFGTDHHLKDVNTYEEFRQAVPVRDYEALRPYIDRVKAGEPDVLWKGKPIYFSKTSGTTSGTKYIPITQASISNHINSAKNALLCYLAETRNTRFVDGKMIFLQGSPVLSDTNGIPTGRLSGIVAHHVPAYLQRNRMPSHEINCIDDWETKVQAIAKQTGKEDMSLISGIPSWLQMYFEELLQQTGAKDIGTLFPNFSLLVYGGVNYGPYRATFEKLIGRSIDTVEVYPASEGFIAYQDSQKHPGLLPVINDGIFLEFIPLSEVHNENPKRLSLEEVELDVNYAVILNTNAGLYGYSIGDTVRFVSREPFRLVVSGRIKHFISAFGEHVIAEEVESTMREVQEQFGAEVAEFHVAPQVNPTEGLPHHEWFIEFNQVPENKEGFRLAMDRLMQQKNSYYRDLLEGKILKPLVITAVERGGFVRFMKARGKLGGQNKIPRLANDRNVADELKPFVLEQLF